jgi:transcription initiation factor TFIIIB Brf1 subunit/transcription initiation factor TFIIB
MTEVKLGSGAAGIRTAIGVFNKLEKRLHLSWTNRMAYQKLVQTAAKSPDLEKKLAEPVGVGLLFVLVKQEGIETTFKELCAFSNVSRSSAIYATRIVSAVFDVALCDEVDKPSPEDVVIRYAKELGLSKRTKAGAVNISIYADALKLAEGETNECIAATAILLAIQAAVDFHTMEDLAKLSDVPANRLKKLFNQLHPSAKELFPWNHFSGHFSLIKLHKL